MKNLIVILFLFFWQQAFAQIVDIPDINFKNALIEQGVDTNGDGEIQESEVFWKTSLDIQGYNINSLIGIKSFINLEYLDCAANKLISLDLTGLTKLKELVCSFNILSNLEVQENINLITLNCGVNHLTSLDLKGNVNLQTLKCSANQLKTIDFTENLKLQDLDCSSNQFVSINLQGLTNLQTFICASNQITEISIQGLTNLYYFDCSDNQLTSLNVQGLTKLKSLLFSNNHLTNLNLQGLTSLTNLRFDFNQFTNLDFQGINSLEYLYCDYNQFTSLNLEGMINMKELHCEHNLLDTLNLQSLKNLKELRCNDNQLTSLDIQGQTKLELLVCNFNQLPSLNLQGLKNLHSMYCSDNNLSNLNMEDLTNLYILNCSNNNLKSLDLKGNTSFQFLYCENNNFSTLYIKNNHQKIITFFNNPNLKYICCDDFEIEYIKSQAISNGMIDCSINSYCSFTPGGIFYTLKGENKIDLDNNGCNAGDSTYPYLKFSITNNVDTGTVLTFINGQYSIPLQTGTHLLKPIIEKPDYFTTSPTAILVKFPDDGDTVIQNFCITPKGIHHDVQVTMIPTTPARPGFIANYKIIFKNHGTQTESGTINFVFDDALLDFLESAISPDAQSTGLLSWNFTDLKPFESRTINIVLNVNSPMETPPVNVGDILNFETSISINNLDEVPIDNLFNLAQTVVGSFDPNDKTCLEGNTIPPSKTGQYVHYLVRFENTGTYAAENVVVKDVIDNKVFIVESLQITDASHKMFTRINGNVVEFIFEDIQLPFDDANNDGYVAFEIKTRPNLKIGDVLKNKAEIYFDYNLPIITNEAQTLVKNAVRTTEAKELAIDFYPNPAKDHVKFLINDQIEKAQVYDLNGKILRSTSVSNNELNIQELQSGTYMVRLFAKNNVYVAKVVKM